MKKNMKKIFSLLLVVMLVAFQFSFLLNVKAETITVSDVAGEVDTDSFFVTNQATITVTGVSSTDQFAAYKVLDVFYNKTSNVVTYEFTDAFEAFLGSDSKYEGFSVDDYYAKTSGDITSGSVKTESTLDALASEFAAYVKQNAVEAVPMTVSGTTATAAVTVGSYLVLPTVNTNVYAVMVGNADLSAEGSEWKVNSPSIVAKVSAIGSFTKSVRAEGYSEGSFAIDGVYNYIVKAGIPQYPTNAVNKKYTITETLDAGITFAGIDFVSIKDGETELVVNSEGTVTNAAGNQVATIMQNGQVITFEFDTDYVMSNNITITYNASLNDSAVIGSAGNASTTTLVYSNDPYGAGTLSGSASATVYTYVLEVYNYGNVDGRPSLVGAEFDVYADLSLETKIGSIVIDETGKATLVGVASGTYYLRQTKAPAGYSLITDPIEVKVGPIEGSAAGETEGHYVAEIENNKAGLLPSTGGIGTVIYTFIGLSIVLLGAIAVISYRKKATANN